MLIDTIINVGGNLKRAVGQLCSYREACKKVTHRAEILIDAIVDAEELLGSENKSLVKIKAQLYEAMVEFTAVITTQNRRLRLAQLFTAHGVIAAVERLHDSLDDLNTRISQVMDIIQITGLPKDRVTSVTQHLNADVHKQTWRQDLQVERREQQSADLAQMESHGEALGKGPVDEALAEMMELLYEMKAHGPDHFQGAEHDVAELVIKKMQKLVGLAGLEHSPQWFIPASRLQRPIQSDSEQKKWSSGSHGPTETADLCHNIAQSSSQHNVIVKSLPKINHVRMAPLTQTMSQHVPSWTTVSHPHVARVYGACPQSQPPAVIRAYAQDGSLRDYLQSQPMEKREKLLWYLTFQACQGLLYLHSKKVVHGSLKGSNILVANGKATLVDYGLHHLVSHASKRDRELVVEELNCGEDWRWAAPELCNGRRSLANEACDVYSMGMCILEALTGEPPWSNVVSEQAKLEKQQFGVPTTRPSPGVSEQAWGLIQLFSRHIKKWEVLDHTHLARVIGANFSDGTPKIMHEDATLCFELGTVQRDPEKFWPVMLQVAEALSELCTNGIVHGHLRCSSILVGSDKTIKLADYGITALVQESGGEIQKHWQSMAPELLYTSQTRPTKESDIYSLGMCLLKAILGRDPWSSMSKHDKRTLGYPQNLMDIFDSTEPKTLTMARKLVTEMCHVNPMKRLALDVVLTRLRDMVARAKSDKLKPKLLPGKLPKRVHKPFGAHRMVSAAESIGTPPGSPTQIDDTSSEFDSSAYHSDEIYFHSSTVRACNLRDAAENKMDEPEAALDLYTDAIKACNDHRPTDQLVRLQCLMARSACSIELGRLKDAVADCSEVLEIDPNNSVMRMRRADALFELNCLEEARADYSHVLKSDSRSTLVLMCCIKQRAGDKLVEICQIQGRPSKRPRAIAQCRR
ncbi:TPA: hypothetical protein N0F65_006213 [Lagenidium giganteum]|uniref:non-specific serine/threonine protein kinase n=1 Tax=Lagenidium giganteum TaxID=4803 RepID=A0AAV2Z4P8_9STRA|nr:TPA: hypothetical protein N0F65_006213 [Lagenidium giganteum]